MAHQQTQTQATIALIDASPEQKLGKQQLLRMLKTHRVNITSVKHSSVPLQEVIPTLRKAKTKTPEPFYKALSQKLDYPFVSFKHIKEVYQNEQKGKLITVIPYPVISKYKIIPINVRDSSIDLAIDNPLNEKVLVTVRYLFASRKINIYVASTEAIEWAIENIYRKIHAETASLDLYNRTPDQSAHKVLYPKQKYFIVTLIAIITASLIINTALTCIILLGAVSVIYFLFNPIKIYISLRGFRGARQPEQRKVQDVADKDLPVYTILVPLYHEAAVLPKLLANMYKLNYPKDKLDIKILLEEKDRETLSEAESLGLFGSPKKVIDGVAAEKYLEFLQTIDPIVIPSAKVTTKPRACNYGLLRAKGEFCVIYDAEDKPDPEQLRKAVDIFLNSSPDVVCLQSKLNFYNADENLLTRWFSIEYANWYEFYLQGLDWIEAPIPLGGTSNHFRKQGLDQLGRWDPYNVTEDADIGIRLARQKLKTEMIDSYTLEEAPISAKSWIIQRSRWYKGHLQTYLVHMRNPRKLLKDLGVEKILKLQFTFGASVFVPVINPILWLLTIASILLPMNIGWLTPSYLQAICLFNLIIGNASYLLIYAIACIKLGKKRNLPYALLMPGYWVLLSVASWRGLIQLARNPFYWDKTSHGVSKKAATT